jgi:stalled ribosome alternative rescue factor ArfA
MKRRNFIAKELLTPKFKPKIVKPKKGKGSFKRQKVNISLTNKTT